MDFLNEIIIPGFLFLAVVVVVTLVLYFVSVTSMKEKTYDEVVAERKKKKTEEILAQGKTAKEKAKDKKLKKAGKRAKEKKLSESQEQSSEEGDNSKNHVAFDESPVVVDLEQKVIKEKKKKNNKKKEKPILVNKNEISPITEVPPLIVNRFEHIVPKDDLLLKQNTCREEIEVKHAEPLKPSSGKQPKAQTVNPPKEVKVEKQPSQKPVQPIQKPTEKVTKKEEKKHAETNEKPVAPKPQEKVQEKPKAVEEIVSKVQKAASGEQPSPSNKGGRKKRNELSITLQQMSETKDSVNASLLRTIIPKAELSHSDVQELIDLLLNKQLGMSEDSAEWIEGRQDPVVKLKKQLAEKERALDEEQQAAVALQNKLRELRVELNAERHNARQMEEGITTRQVELGNLNSRLKLFTDEKQGLVEQIQQLQTQLNEEHLMRNKVQEDHIKTQNVMQQELLTQRQQLERHIACLAKTHEENIILLERQMAQMSDELRQKEELRERAHLHDSQDLNCQLKELHSEVERLRSKSQYDTNHLQSEITSLTEQLNLKRSETEKLGSLVQNLQSENNRLTHQISSACVEAQQLREENENLAAQVTASMERPATEGRENGDLSYPETKHIEEETNANKLNEKDIMVEKLQDDINIKDKEINRYKLDCSQQESQIKSLKKELDKAYSSSELMLKEISSYKMLIQEHEGVIRNLKEDITRNKVEISRLSQDCATREQLESRESTIEKLTSELNTHKTELADQTVIIKTLKAEIEKYKAEEANQQRQGSTELERLIANLAERDAELKSIKLQVEKLQGELVSMKDSVAQLTTEKNNLRTQLDAQVLKNDGLRTKNWKAMEALSAAEKKLESKMKQTQNLVNETERRAKLEEQERTKQLLQRIVPNISVDSNKDYELWLKQFMTSSCNNAACENNEAAMLAEVEQQNCQLQAMVTRYKTIIGDTEGMLNRLQNHVEQEEERWGQQIQTLKSQLQAVTQERDRLEAGMKTLATVDAGLDTN